MPLEEAEEVAPELDEFGYRETEDSDEAETAGATISERPSTWLALYWAHASADCDAGSNRSEYR